MSVEIMKQALAKFERLWEIGIDAEYKVELLPEIQALRQAIEQAEKQEPVGWFDWDAKREIWVQVYPHTHGKPLYDEPPKREWVGLTDEESSELYNKNYDLYDTDMTFMDFFMVQREVETKLKEKNT